MLVVLGADQGADRGGPRTGVLAGEGTDDVGIDTAFGGGALRRPAGDMLGELVEAQCVLGDPVVVGESLTSEAEETNPVIPSVVLPYRYEYTLVGMEPCPAPRGTCAHLRVVAFTDPSELTRVMSDALQQLGLTALSFERVVQLTMMTVLAEPTTLLPHAVRVSKQVDGILLDQGERRIFHRADHTQLIYTY